MSDPLADALRDNRGPDVQLRTAVVSDTAPLTVTLAGVDVPATTLASYATPVVDDVVAVLQANGAILVLGKKV